MKKIIKNKISIVGLGKLGLPLMACFAARGFKVIGVDINENVVDAVNRGESPITETELAEVISEFKKNIRATQNHEEAIRETDISYVIVATPSDPKGNFSNAYVESALKSLAKSFGKSNKKYHLFVISSTVMPGSTEKRLIPLIEKHSGKKLNVDFGVCYVPDFVALGSVINNFLNPDLVLIGESNKFAGDQLIPIYQKFCKNEPHLARMSIISGEIAKIALNNYITLKISFANSLANLCEKIPGADVDAITKAIGADKRISPYYLKGGLSFGGTCFPRDVRAYLAFSHRHGYKAKLTKAAEEINKFQDNHLLEIVLKNLSFENMKKVSVLGLSFKPNTPVIVESPAVKFIDNLLKEGIKVTVYDPLAVDNTKNVFRDKIQYAKSVRECLSRSSCWVITTPDEKFKNIDNGFVISKPTIIIDCWRILNPQSFSKGVKYIKWGHFIQSQKQKKRNDF